MILPLLRKMIEIRLVYDLWDDWGGRGWKRKGRNVLYSPFFDSSSPVFQDVD